MEGTGGWIPDLGDTRLLLAKQKDAKNNGPPQRAEYNEEALWGGRKRSRAQQERSWPWVGEEGFSVAQKVQQR